MIDLPTVIYQLINSWVVWR